MRKIKTATAVILAYGCFLLLWPLVCQAEEVLLWQKEDAGVYGVLPDGWQVMSSEELETFSKAGKELSQGPGEFVSGFLLKKEKNSSSTPVILVFVNQGQQVSRVQMQKTYSWFEKNNELTSGGLPPQVKGMTIKNIDYLQDRFTLLFLVRMALEEKALAGISGTVFLQNGYLNIIGFVNEENFSDYAETFYTFISTLSVPASLRQGFPETASDRFFSALTWMVDHWQPISGAVLLLGIYGVVFWREEKK